MTITWPEWAKKVAESVNDHQRKLTGLSEQLATLERKLQPLLDAMMEGQILKILSKEGKPRTWGWLQRRLGSEAYEPLLCLVNKGLVKTEWSGPHLLYKLAEEAGSIE